MEVTQRCWRNHPLLNLAKKTGTQQGPKWSYELKLMDGETKFKLYFNHVFFKSIMHEITASNTLSLFIGSQ